MQGGTAGRFTLKHEFVTPRMSSSSEDTYRPVAGRRRIQKNQQLLERIRRDCFTDLPGDGLPNDAVPYDIAPCGVLVGISAHTTVYRRQTSEGDPTTPSTPQPQRCSPDESAQLKREKRSQSARRVRVKEEISLCFACACKPRRQQQHEKRSIHDNNINDVLTRTNPRPSTSSEGRCRSPGAGPHGQRAAPSTSQGPSASTPPATSTPAPAKCVLKVRFGEDPEGVHMEFIRKPSAKKIPDKGQQGGARAPAVQMRNKHRGPKPCYINLPSEPDSVTNNNNIQASSKTKSTKIRRDPNYVNVNDRSSSVKVEHQYINIGYKDDNCVKGGCIGGKTAVADLPLSSQSDFWASWDACKPSK